MLTQYIRQHLIAGGRVRASLAKIVRQPLDCRTGGVQGEGEAVDLLIFLGNTHSGTPKKNQIPAPATPRKTTALTRAIRKSVTAAGGLAARGLVDARCRCTRHQSHPVFCDYA